MTSRAETELRFKVILRSVAAVCSLLQTINLCGGKAVAATSAWNEHLHTPPASATASGLTSSRVVPTQYGKVRGVLLRVPQPGRITKLSLYPGNPPATVEVFYGLQYATVFGGNLRFMPPTSSIEKWEGIKLAGNFQPVCPQKIPNLEEIARNSPLKRVERVERMIPFLRHQDEECLFLNIYAPYSEKLPLSNSSSLPVLMFIHGESYDFGSGNSMDGRVLAAFGFMIVVTINYRLGVLGFLSTTDSDATGNYALLDQVAALHWIRANIQGFGGNPDNVTIMGQGHGATMASILMMSPVTKGSNLFQKVILQSGSALSSSAIDRTPLAWTWHVSERVNCSQFWSNSRSLVDCLKKLHWQALVNVPIPNFRYRASFGPTIDGRSVLPHEPEVLLKEQCCDSSLTFPDVMIGVTRDEGLQYLNESQIENGIERGDLQLQLRTFVQNVFTYNRQYIYEVVYHQYQDWQTERDSRSVRDFVADFLGDSLHVAPTIDLVRRRVNNIQQHAHFLQTSGNHSVDQSKTKTFVYCFNFGTSVTSSSSSSSSSFGMSPGRHLSALPGDELTYIFGEPLLEQMENLNSRILLHSDKDREFSEMIMIHWKNFIHSGNPNPKVNGQLMMSRDWTTSWIEYDAWSQSYLEIDEKPTLRHFYKVDKIALWLDLIPKLHRSDASKDPRHHQLDDHLNRSTFLATGTKFDDVRLDSTTHSPPSSSSSSSSSFVPSSSVESWNGGNVRGSLERQHPHPHPHPHQQQQQSTAKTLTGDKTFAHSANQNPQQQQRQQQNQHLQQQHQQQQQQQQQRSSNLKKSSKRTSTTLPTNLDFFQSRNKTIERNLQDLHFVRDSVSFQEGTGGAPGGGGESGGGEGGGTVGETENLPLTVTLAVGCGLLFVNLFIFGLVCFRKAFVLRRQTSNSRKLRQYKLHAAAATAAAAAAASSSSSSPFSSFPRNRQIAVDTCLEQSPAASDVNDQLQQTIDRNHLDQQQQHQHQQHQQQHQQQQHLHHHLHHLPRGDHNRHPPPPPPTFFNTQRRNSQQAFVTAEDLQGKHADRQEKFSPSRMKLESTTHPHLHLHPQTLNHPHPLHHPHLHHLLLPPQQARSRETRTFDYAPFFSAGMRGESSDLVRLTTGTCCCSEEEGEEEDPSTAHAAGSDDGSTEVQQKPRHLQEPVGTCPFQKTSAVDLGDTSAAPNYSLIQRTSKETDVT